MKEITVEQLHEDTERWVKEAAGNGALLITAEGRLVALLSQFGPVNREKWLRERLAELERLPFNPVDSSAYVSEDRERP